MGLTDIRFRGQTYPNATIVNS